MTRRGAPNDGARKQERARRRGSDEGTSTQSAPPFSPFPPNLDGGSKLRRLEAVDLDEVLLREPLLDEELGHVLALVALKLDHL